MISCNMAIKVFHEDSNKQFALKESPSWIPVLLFGYQSNSLAQAQIDYYKVFSS